MLRCSISYYYLPKRGSQASEYEDAFFPNCNSFEGYTFRVAIADGATESSYSDLWARKLVETYVKQPFVTSSDFRQRITQIGNELTAYVNTLDLPWFAEEKVQRGAFSTLLGLTLNAPSSDWATKGSWKVTAVGDSCLFILRQEKLIKTFPLSSYSEFNSSPQLVSSKDNRNKQLSQNIKDVSGVWQKGDIFILATDALAAWFFNEVENGTQPWNELRVFTNNKLPNSNFSTWIDLLRNDKVIKNDDVTCVIIQIR